MPTGFGDDFFDAALGMASEPLTAFLGAQSNPGGSYGAMFTDRAQQPQGASFTDSGSGYDSPAGSDFLRPLQDAYASIASSFTQPQQAQSDTGFSGYQPELGNSVYERALSSVVSPIAASQTAQKSPVAAPAISVGAVEPNRASLYYNVARKAAIDAGIDPEIFARQMSYESGGFDMEVISGRKSSSAGALGIAQFMPATAADLGVNPLDPQAALNAAAKLMAQYLQKYGSYELALRAYNEGPGGVDRGAIPWESGAYVQRILGADPQGPPIPTSPTSVEQPGGGAAIGTSSHVAVGAASGQPYGVSFDYGARYDTPIRSDITGELVYDHRGIDLVIPGLPNGGYGTPIGSFVDGRVVQVGRAVAAGNYVVVQDQQGLFHWYMHLAEPGVSTGTQVARGQAIGTLGDTGAEGQPHLHYEVRRQINADPIDPRPFIGAR